MIIFFCFVGLLSIYVWTALVAAWFYRLGSTAEQVRIQRMLSRKEFQEYVKLEAAKLQLNSRHHANPLNLFSKD